MEATSPDLTLRQFQIPMADGINLAADLYLPDGDDGPWPALLAMTPYGKQNLGGALAQAFAPRGYAVLTVDVRGRYESAGDFRPLVQERADAPAVCEWIAAQPWFDRDAGIGTIGLSYLATAGFMAAAGSPWVKAATAVTVIVDLASGLFTGGVLNLHHALPWFIITGLSPQPDLTEWDWTQLYKHVPLATLDEAAALDLPAWRESLVEAYDSTQDPAKLSIRSELRDCKVPVLHLAGWYDFILGESLAAYGALADAGAAPQAMVLGPWTHKTIVDGRTRLGDRDYGPEASSRLMERLLGWFDYWLQGKGQPVQGVQAYLTGGAGWRHLPAWPPPDAKTLRLGLAPDSAEMDGIDLAGTGWGGNALHTLTATAVVSDGWLSYSYDPDDPTPTIGGAVWPFSAASLEPGPADQRALAGRSDGLTFLTPPLTDDVDVLGPARVKLVAATDTPDTDFAVRLFDAAPNGGWEIIGDGIARARYREGFHLGKSPERLLRPGETFELEVDLAAVGHRFARGHRIGLHVSGANFPKFARNLNTGGHPLWEDGTREATQRIRTGASALYLTLAPPADD